MYKSTNDIDTIGMVVLQLFSHRTTEFEQASTMVPLYRLGPENFCHSASGSRPPNFKLKKTITRSTVALRKNQVVLRFRVDMRDPPLIF